VTAADPAGGLAEGPVRAAARTAPHEAWRRAVHAASGLFGPLALDFPGRSAGFVLFGGLAVIALALEVARRASPAAWRGVDAVGGSLFRPEEAHALSGPATLAWGYALSWGLFAPRVAATAIVVAALADPAAALVGRRLGRGAPKSAAGSAACAAVSAAILLLAGAGAPAAAAGAVLVTFAERAPWPGVDNVLVPLAAGAALTLLGHR
jgi:dolichol kinase